jgi:cytochrome b
MLMMIIVFSLSNLIFAVETNKSELIQAIIIGHKKIDDGFKI